MKFTFVASPAGPSFFFEKKTKQKKLHPANSHTQNSEKPSFKIKITLNRILIVFKQCWLIYGNILFYFSAIFEENLKQTTEKSAFENTYSNQFQGDF